MSTAIRATVVRVTPRAVLLSYEGEEVWVPLSCLDDPLDSDDEGEDADLSLATWKARELGWE